MTISTSIQVLLEKGIAAAKLARQKPVSSEIASLEHINTQRIKARSLLVRVLKEDKNNVDAWLWLSTVVDTPQEQKICLRNVLTVNPHNKYALAGLAQLEQLDTLPKPSSVNVAKNYENEKVAPALAAPPKTPQRKNRTLSRIQPSAAKIPAGTPKSGTPGCPFCQGPISSINTTCPHCQLLLVMTCPACGEAVDVEQSTCRICRQKMGNYHQREMYFARLGEEYLKNQRYQDAVKAWKTVELLDENFPQLYVRLGQSHLGMGRPDRATTSFQHALEQTPNNPDVHFALGEIMHQRAALEEAFDCYQTVIRLNPKHGLAWFRTAEILGRVGAREKAIKAYRTAIKLLPANSQEYSQAQVQLERFEPKLPERMATGWPELIRQITGPILICVIAVLFDSGLRPWWIQMSGWLALILAPVGAFLFVSGSSLPRNPLIQMIVGKRGLSVKEYKIIVTVVGALLWLAAMGLVLLPINQSYPEIPEL